MKWPTVAELATLMPAPEGYRFEPIAHADITTVIASLKVWHPDISVGVSSCYLREDFYLKRVCLDDAADKDVWVVLLRFRGELVGFWSVEREVDSLAIFARLLVMAPAHRGANLSAFVMTGGENIGRSMGAAFLYTLATLKIPHVQRALEHADYRLLGFFPGYDREEVAPGVV
ncbi:MAG: hypothetical protein ACREBN_01485, partial [Burkholderiaceae bacterium]